MGQTRLIKLGVNMYIIGDDAWGYYGAAIRENWAECERRLSDGTELSDSTLCGHVATAAIEGLCLFQISQKRQRPPPT